MTPSDVMMWELAIILGAVAFLVVVVAVALTIALVYMLFDDSPPSDVGNSGSFYGG